jgi:hypothetical protein
LRQTRVFSRSTRDWGYTRRSRRAADRTRRTRDAAIHPNPITDGTREHPVNAFKVGRIGNPSYREHVCDVWERSAAAAYDGVVHPNAWRVMRGFSSRSRQHWSAASPRSEKRPRAGKKESVARRIPLAACSQPAGRHGAAEAMTVSSNAQPPARKDTCERRVKMPAPMGWARNELAAAMPTAIHAPNRLHPVARWAWFQSCHGTCQRKRKA